MKIIEIIDYLPSRDETFDAIIISSGSESRATNISKKYPVTSPLKIAIECNSFHAFAYESNEVHINESGYIKVNIDHVRAFLKAASTKKKIASFKVLVDISCLSRPSMAELIFSILGLTGPEKIEIVFCYSLAEFNAPSMISVPNEAIEPVHLQCSGWPSQQSNPTSLIIGLGYEPDKAEGASEYLDPAEQWGFIPVSPIKEFLSEVEQNNSNLIGRLAEQNRTIKYNVQQPAATFGQLELVITDLLLRSNPILLPFGPKIFFAVCLVQGVRHPEVGVWHVTGELNEEAVDRHASGVEVGFRVVFSNIESEAEVNEINMFQPN